MGRHKPGDLRCCFCKEQTGLGETHGMSAQMHVGLWVGWGVSGGGLRTDIVMQHTNAWSPRCCNLESLAVLPREICMCGILKRCIPSPWMCCGIPRSRTVVFPGPWDSRPHGPVCLSLPWHDTEMSRGLSWKEELSDGWGKRKQCVYPQIRL